MAFPYGSSMTNVELARKFGWPSMILSILLLPVTFIWSKLLAFPVWLDYKYETKPKCMVYNTFRYENPGDENLFQKEFYFSPTNVARCPSGWNCHVDKEGGIFFESFFGLINCLDITFESKNVWVIRPNFWSWLILSEVKIFFHPDDKGHSILFYFPLDGMNKYNPFFWATMTYIVMGIKLWSKWSFKPFMEDHGVEFKPLSDKVDLEQFDIEDNMENLEVMQTNESTRLISANHALLHQFLSPSLEVKTKRPLGESLSIR